MAQTFSSSWDISSIEWHNRTVVARARLVFPTEMPLKLCKNQYLPSYRHSLTCAGSNNDMNCTVFDRDGIVGVRKCEYDAKSSSPLPNGKLNCCLGQSNYTCCIRRCGMDNTNCYDDDKSLGHVLFQKMDSEYQRRTSSIGGVKSGCYTAMGNVDLDSIFQSFGKAIPRCVGGTCVQKCPDASLICPSKSCSTKQCFTPPEGCRADGNWQLDINKNTIDPRQIPGSIVCEFFFDFPSSYNMTSVVDLRVWMDDLILHTPPELSSRMVCMAIAYHSHMIFYNDIYHLSQDSVNLFASQKFISTDYVSVRLDEYKQNIVAPLNTYTKTDLKPISDMLILPYMSANGILYMTLTTSQINTLMKLRNTSKANAVLENMLTNFLQDDATKISPSSLYHVQKSELRWNYLQTSDIIVNVLDISVPDTNGKVNVKPIKLQYDTFIQDLKKTYFIVSYDIPLHVVSYSPMLVAYLESRSMVRDSSQREKMVSDTSLLPLSLTDVTSPSQYEEDTSNHCQTTVSNTKVMPFPGAIFLSQGSAQCRCVRSSLVPTAVSFEEPFYNKTSMCFQKTCQDPLSKTSYGLDDTYCKTECATVSSWMGNMRNPQDFDQEKYATLCAPEPSPPPPSPVKPTDHDATLRKRIIVLIIVVAFIMLFLIFMLL